MNTRTIKKKSPKKAPKRRRKMPYIHTGNYHLEDELMEILHEGDHGTIVYVYRAKDRSLIPPFLFKRHPFPGLFEYIRDEYGSGEYAITIRQGTTMIFTGITRIEAPINWQPPG
jgi:hypothetical protein